MWNIEYISFNATHQQIFAVRLHLVSPPLPYFSERRLKMSRYYRSFMRQCVPSFLFIHLFVPSSELFIPCLSTPPYLTPDTQHVPQYPTLPNIYNIHALHGVCLLVNVNIIESRKWPFRVVINNNNVDIRTEIFLGRTWLWQRLLWAVSLDTCFSKETESTV